MKCKHKLLYFYSIWDFSPSEVHFASRLMIMLTCFKRFIFSLVKKTIQNVLNATSIVVSTSKVIKINQVEYTPYSFIPLIGEDVGIHP